MKNIKTYLVHILKWTVFVFVGAFIILIIIRFFHYSKVHKIDNQVIKIENTKLSIDDVSGKNLPPDPGKDKDKTVQGIDENKNGIRDDVELAVFKEYPNSAKTRAVLLQYALALQMEFIQPFLGKDIVTKLLGEESRADTCLSDTLVPRKSLSSSRTYDDISKIDNFINFIKKVQINTEERITYQKNFYEYLGYSGGLKNSLLEFSSQQYSCDIDLSKLPN